MIKACIRLAVVGWLVAPAAGEVLITEIMYNPASSEKSPNDVEWIEIYNTADEPVDVAGWYLEDEDGRTDAIVDQTQIAGHEALVLICGTQTVADFQAAWGGRYAIVSLPGFGRSGYFVLANQPSPSNEIVTLRDADGNVVDEVNYDDEGDWPSDGPDGPSIYLRPDRISAAQNDQGSSWARSAVGVDGGRGNTVTADFDGKDVGSPGTVVVE